MYMPARYIGKRDEVRQEHPAEHRAHPVGDKVADAEQIHAAGIGDEVAGVDRRGKSGKPDDPPGEASGGEKPIAAAFGAAGSEQRVQNDCAVETDHQCPVDGLHGVTGGCGWMRCPIRPRDGRR